MQQVINLIASRVGIENIPIHHDHASPIPDTELHANDANAQMHQISQHGDSPLLSAFKAKNDPTGRTDLVSKGIISLKQAEGFYDL